MRKTNIQITILLIFCLLSGYFPAFSAYASEITSERVVLLVNQERSKEGLSGLERSGTLDRVAQDKAEDMLKKDYFAHTSPEGTTPWFWFEKEGYDYEYAGENLAVNFIDAEKQSEAWMKSVTHRKNILSSNFDEIGVAVVRGKIGGRETIITVQEFGSRDSAPLVAGQSLKKSENFSATLEQENNIINDTQNPKKDGFLAGLVFQIRSVDYLRVMKGFVAISAFMVMILFFASFVRKLSEVGEMIGRIGKKIFRKDFDFKNVHSEEHRIVIRFFPMDMKKISVTNYCHMKQRE